jgi:CHAT domain-containing protein/tetratricopeptide (TPR) repeat protein
VTRGDCGRAAGAVILLLALARPLCPQAPADPLPERARALVAQVLAAADEPARAALLAAAPPELRGGPLGAAFLERARSLLAAGETAAADRSFGYALRLAEETGDRKAEAAVLNSLARLHHQRGDFDAALHVLRRAEAIAVETGDLGRQAGVLNNMAVMHRALGDYEEALALYERSLALVGGPDDGPRRALVLNNIGVVHMNRGDHRSALALFEQSLSGLPADNPDRSLNYSNMGEIHQAQGDLDLAADYYQRAIALDEKSGRRNELPYSFVLMGDLARRQERPLDAERWFERALAEARQVEDASVEVDALTRLGELALARRDAAGALSWLERARAQAQSMRLSDGLARAQIALARALLAAGRAADGFPHAKGALDLADRMHAPFLAWEAQTVLGRLHVATGQHEEARHAFSEGVAAIEEWREHAAGDESTTRFLEDKLEPYHALVALEAAEGRTEEALRWAERAHARTLTDVLRRGGIDQGALDADQSRESRRLERRLVQLHLRRAALGRADEGGGASRAVDPEIQQARRELAAFRARVEAERPALRLAGGAAAGDPLSTVPSLLGPRGALLVYTAAPDRLHLFVVTADGGRTRVEHHAQELTARALGERVQAFRRRLSERGLQVRAQAQELHQLVMGPASATLRGRTRLLIVPDGPLWELPFAVLETRPGRYLLDDAAVSYAPSLTALGLLHQRPGTGARAADTLLAVGNPTVPASAPSGLGPLGSAGRQVRALGRLYGPDRSRVLVGADAQEARVRAEAERFDVLHFATHGLLDDASPLFSYLVMAGAGVEPERDGRLEAREVMRMRLHARLVVLAACETGRGRIGAGEGTIGLSWAFALAGSPTVVASHWSVDAQGTSDLMLALHRGLRSRSGGAPIDVAQRLREASLLLRHDPRYRHPFYWGGFFVMGSASL